MANTPEHPAAPQLRPSRGSGGSRARCLLRRHLLILLASLSSLGIHAPSATAQVTPADSAAVLLETAQTFEARRRGDVAEAIYRLIVERYPGTPAAATAALRLELAPAMDEVGDGRVSMLVWSTLYGAWLGVAVPGAFGADSPEPYGLGLLIGTPLGFGVGRAVGRTQMPTQGQASAISLGAWWGTWQGFGWQEVFDIGVQQQCQFGRCYDAEDSGQEAFAAAIVGGAMGITAGALLSRSDVSAGTGTAVNFGALWGTWFGFAAGTLMDLEDDGLLAATLLGGDAGLLSAATLVPGWNVSRSRARMVSIAGVLGGLAGAGFDLLLQPDSEKVAVAIPLVGSVAGLIIGVASTNDGEPAANRAPGETPLQSALLDWRDGQLLVSPPLPVPVFLPDDRPGQRGWATGLRVELFRASF